MTGRRRLGIAPARPPQGYAPGVIINREPVSAPTVQMNMRPVPDTDAHRDSGVTHPAADEPYVREPVPDRDSTDPADRQEFLDAIGQDEPLFEATVADLDAEWLVYANLPVPPRPAPQAAEAPDAGPGVVPPPAGEEAGPAAAQASPETPGPVSDASPGAPPSGGDRDQTAPEAPGLVPAADGEPAADEPDAEPDCGETGGVA